MENVNERRNYISYEFPFTFIRLQSEEIFIAALIMQRAWGALKSMLRLLINVNYLIISTPWENLYSKRISAN